MLLKLVTIKKAHFHCQVENGGSQSEKRDDPIVYY